MLALVLRLSCNAPFSLNADVDTCCFCACSRHQGKGLDCKGVCNAPAAKTTFRMKMPSASDAMAGKWPGDWVKTAGQSYEEMPYGRVFADAVLLPNGQVRMQADG